MKLFKNFYTLTICLLCCFTLLLVPNPNKTNLDVKADTLTPNSKASVLMEYDTKQVLYEHNSKQALPIASVTKLMTILLTLENIDENLLSLDEKVTISENASGMGGSQVFLDANTEHTVSNLLKAVIVASANDASVALAERIAGSESEFVNQMNTKASELKLENTNFVNCSGLPAPNHYSCAYDVAIIMSEVLKHPTYFNYSKIWMEDYPHPSGRVTNMANTNKLVRFYNGCDAGKTGSTNEAGYCLSATAKRNDMRLISVVLGADTSKTRFADASDLFDWGFANYSSQKLVDSQSLIENQVKLQKSKANSIELVPAENFSYISKKGEKPLYEVNYELPNAVSAPIKQGDKIGKIIITKEGVIEKEIDIVSNQDIEPIGYFDTMRKVLDKWSL